MQQLLELGKIVVYRALVLKNHFPKKNKVTLLHEQLGKITFFIDEKHDAAKLCNGSLIYCDVTKKNSSYRCDFIDAYFVPFHEQTDDLYFIHDILKICLQFMPDQTTMTDVFEVVLDAYQHLEDLPACHKKIYLLKIFLFLGIFPENKKLYQSVMIDSSVHNCDTDTLLQKGLQFCWQSDENYA